MRDIMRLKTERELVRVKIHDGNAFWNEIGVNAGVSKLMLLSLNLLLPVLVNAAKLKLTAASIIQVNAVKGDFNKYFNSEYALMVNPTIYTSCIKQFWATAKVQTINKEVQIQALVDGKKVIVTETSVRRALHLKDAKGTDCLPIATIFAELKRMGYENLTQKLTFYKAFFSPQWKFLIHTILQCLSAKTTAWNEFSSTMASAILCLATNQIFNFSKYIFNNMVKNLEGEVKFLMYLKREGDGFSSRITPLFQTMMVQAPKEVGEGSTRKDSGPTEPIIDEATNEEHVSTPSYDPSQSAIEIATLKERVKKLEKKRRSKTYNPKRLYKGRKIANLDADTEVTLIDETQGRNDEDLMFDTGVLNGDEVFQEPMVNTATTTSSIPVSDADPVTTAGEAKDKGKAKMVEPEKPLKKKYQIAINEEVARNLESQLQAELEEEERLSR
ncbi:hypothetical protein Tco_0214639 [Tanacetum coccineum]